MSPVIEVHARARLITDGPLTRPVPVDLRYDAADDPRTVHITLPGGTDWAFGRDLLERGLRTPIERGAVRVWPCGRTQVIVELHSTDGVEVFQFEIRTLIRFLARTRAQAPATAPPDGTPEARPPSRTTRPKQDAQPERGAQPARG
ncbi:SsgA family sporulation/cell division regulator [Streptomyces sp. cmx-18-6]|uniref:SsgA family sporulation/cell division regulator n=1 Tax=Streptomyces sp. cmx-18-6 TaxID=2790930 RepID=UPI00398154D9